MQMCETIHCRWMISSDLVNVLRIERNSFEYPWDEDGFRKRLGQQNAVGIVAERDGVVVGYAVFELLQSSVHLLNINVDSFVHRCGVGKELLSQIKRRLNAAKRNRIIVEVRESNLNAQLFFRSQGFRCVNILDDHWSNCNEQAYMFQYRV